MIVPEFLTTSGNLQADRRFEFACGLAEEGDYTAAIDLLYQTAPLVPMWPVIPYTLGKYYKAAGQADRAIHFFNHSRALDPQDHQGAALELERLGLNIIEDNMPPAFVETLFDQYAGRFDQHLVNILDYQVPEMIASIARHYYNTAAPIDILDLGCGTGLAGEHLKSLASYLEGVDLSTGMLDQAREKNIYSHLVQGELVAHLNAGQRKFPLIIAADVLIYFGGLETLFTAVKARLDRGGHFIFSVQALAEPPPDPAQGDFYLDRSRRFSHSKHYIQASLKAASLNVHEIKNIIIRKDEGENVEGYLVVASHQ